MFEILASVDIRGAANAVYALTRRIRENRRIEVLDPSPQGTQVQLSDDQTQILRELIRAIEKQYGVTLDQLDDQQVSNVAADLANALAERVRYERDYKEDIIQARIRELREAMVAEKGWLAEKKIAFVGAGVMAEVIIRALLARGLTVPASIIASDIDLTRLDTLAQRYEIATVKENARAAEKADFVILAISPRNLVKVMEDLKEQLRAEQLVLSIVPSTSLAALSEGLKHEEIVRAMSNTPAQIGQGVTVWTATDAVSKLQRDSARAIFSAMGSEIYVLDERYIDMATAVSGSGPAYVLLFTECFIDAAVHIGLPRALAEKLVLETILGSTQLAQAAGKHPSELRNMVTAPGGITTEGLLRLERGGIRAVMIDAVVAAYEKAQRSQSQGNR